MSPVSRSSSRTCPLALARAGLLMAALLTTATAWADDWPTLRHGMWEFSRTIETQGKPGKPQTLQTRKCTNPTEEMKRQSEMLTKGGCKFTPVTRSGNAYSYSATCKMQGMSGTSKSVLTVDSDGAYTLRVESDFGGESTREVLRARRAGDC